MGDESIIRATLQRYAESWEQRDRAAWLSVFTPTAVQEDPVATPPNRGRRLIGGFWDRAMARYSHIEIRPRRVHVCGHEAAMTWEIIGRDADGWVAFDGVDVFAFAPDGRISSVRAFWEPEGRQRLAIPPERKPAG